MKVSYFYSIEDVEKYLHTHTSLGDIDELLQLLESTTDPNTRDALALALADRKEPKLLAVLAKVCSRRGMHGKRGSLVYAMQELEYTKEQYKPYLSVIYKIAFSSSFEEKCMANMLLNDLGCE